MHPVISSWVSFCPQTVTVAEPATQELSKDVFMAAFHYAISIQISICYEQNKYFQRNRFPYQPIQHLQKWNGYHVSLLPSP